MYRYFLGSDRNSIPTGLPARLVDPTLRTFADNPQFVRIGQGDNPRNELLRKVYRKPSKDVVRTKVISDIYPPTETEPYLSRPDNIAAIRTASEQLGIPLERTGLRIATNPFRLEGDVADFNLLAQITNKAAGNLQRSGKPVLADTLTRKAKFFNQPTSYSELAVDGTEGVEAILEAFKKAEPDVTASSQGNRPILPQAGGLNPNIGIPSGRPENIPWDNIEGMKGANRYVDVSKGLETARVIKYPNIYDRLNNGAQPTVIPTIPYSLDIPTAIGDSILSPKVSIETKRPRFIDEGHGIFTRQGEPINAEQKNLLDMGMADLEDRSFIVRDPADVNRQYTTQRQYWLGRTRDVPVPINEQYRPTTRLGMEVIGLNADRALDPVIIPSKDLWGTTVIPEKRIGLRAATPINRLTDDLSDRVLSGDVDLRNYEPFKSINTPQYYLDQSKEFVGPIRIAKNNTYGATQGKTPWREYYSDPFVYEDKGLDGEVSRLVNAVNEAPAQLENALNEQASANRKVFDIEQQIAYVPSLNRIAKGAKEGSQNITASPETIMDWVEARKVIKPIVAPLQKERRIAEMQASKAQDQIAQLRAAQELMGVEYMVKPKPFGAMALEEYRLNGLTRAATRDSGYEQYPFSRSYQGKVEDAWRKGMAEDKSLFRQANNIPLGMDAIEEFRVGQNYRRYLAEQGDYPETSVVVPRQARPSLAPVFSKPKATIGELFGFSALTPEALDKYKDMTLRY